MNGVGNRNGNYNGNYNCNYNCNCYCNSQNTEVTDGAEVTDVQNAITMF